MREVYGFSGISRLQRPHPGEQQITSPSDLEDTSPDGPEIIPLVIPEENK
jgi:hypothetical protein